MPETELIEITEETKEQMNRFKKWVISEKSREYSLTDIGILVTMIGLCDGNLTIGEIEHTATDSGKTIRRHVKELEHKGLVTLIPQGSETQISKKHYQVNL